MQALNLQILESQTTKTQSNSVSPVKTEHKSNSTTFKDMVQSASRKNAQVKGKVQNVHSANEPEEISESKTDANKLERTDSSKSRISNNKNSDTEVSRSRISDSKKTDYNSSEKNIPALEESIFVQSELSSMNIDALPSDKNILRQYDVFISEDSQEINDISISDNELSYLRTKAPSNDLNSLIENAVEYENTTEFYINAQNLSVEEPVRFLKQQEVAGENSMASDVDISFVSALNGEENLPQLNGADSKKEDTKLFNLEIADSSSEVKSEATSLFKDIFTVTDNRSVDEKIAQFKTMVNEQNESSGENNINLALTLNENAAQNILASNDRSAAASGSTFQEMLTQQVTTSVPDFVKAGNIVLRDNNNGSINMILKPESLGNVKINLQVSDNVITGQITVHSKEAFEAFKQNMDSLRQAFQDSGFENANLNLSFADNSSGAFAQQQGERQQSSEQFFANRSYGDYASSADVSVSDDSETSVINSYGNGSDRQVSIVA